MNTISEVTRPAATRSVSNKPKTLEELFARCRLANEIRKLQREANGSQQPRPFLLVEREPIPPQPIRSVYLPPRGVIARGLIYDSGVAWFVWRERGIRERLAVG